MPEPMRDARALAARGLAEVVAGASLRTVLAEARQPLADPRDRALVTALLNEGARWWLRYQPAIDAMLERPLPRKDAALHALTVLGVVQLEVLGVATHAAVAATVEATRAMGRPRMSGLCNALLRRWQRERRPRLAALDADPVTRHACPRWLVEAVQRDWPSQAEAILAAGNLPQPPVLRVNRRWGNRGSLLQRLHASGVEASRDPRLPDAIRLPTWVDVRTLPGYDEGAFSVQGGAAQWAAPWLDAKPGQRVLDACAAPGGKAAHLLEHTDLELVALDIDATRLARVRENLDRLGLAAELRTGDAAEPAGWWRGQPFARILVDAPCSASGVLRRHPDIKLHRRASDIPALAAGQTRLLAALWPLLAPGGRLLYATCSLLRSENEAVVAQFMAGRDDVRSQPLQAAEGRQAGDGWQFLPGVDRFDGMFYALLEKTARA